MLVKQLREAKMSCSNVAYRAELQVTADHLDMAIRFFCQEQDEASLKALNGAWARGAWVLAHVPPEGSPAPLAPAVDEKLAA